MNAKEKRHASQQKSERLKIVGLILTLPIIGAIGFWADYNYRKVIVKDAIEESQFDPGPKEIARVPYGDGHCILREDLMVVIECSGGRDMLPVSLVSQELVDAFTAQLEAKESSR